MPVTSLLHYAGLTDQGRQRTNNEDRFFGDPDRGLFVIVDGMGGQAAGEVAAETAVTLIRERLGRRIGSLPDRIREAIAVANNEIFEQAQSNPAWHGMACVLTVAVVEDGQVTVGHVGDSRLYLLEPGQIRKVTHDHSPVGEREDRGELSESDAMRHPRRNEVFRDVGSQLHTPSDTDFIEIQQFALPSQGALVLCSDGLSDLVTSQVIRETVERNAADPYRAARDLVAAANEAGGKDNITVLVVTTAEYTGAFAGRPLPSTETVRSSGSAGRWLWPLAALLAGLGAGWFLRQPAQAPPVEPAHVPQTIRVGGEGGLPTVAAAMDKATAGDTVLVSPGQYHEAVRLAEGVSLVSEKPQQAIFYPVGPDPVIRADQVSHGRLEGVLLDDADHLLKTGILLHNADVEITDVEVTHAVNAIEITGNSKASVQACRLYANSGSGMIVRDTAEPRILNNVIARNGDGKAKPDQLRPGIEIAGLARPKLVGNVFVDNGAEAIWKGAWGEDARLLEQNYFVNERKPPARRKIRSSTP